MKKNKVGNIVLGNFIKEKRLESQLTTKQVAELISVSERVYIKYEDGSLSIFIDHLVLLSKIFKVDLKVLFDIYIDAEPSSKL
ncbi:MULTISPECIES: helix-turn-helix transcriptional regulator [Providencia]|uniref:Helix-turn-helix transcriptional regulator n=2 Tax=Providencia TaxID=586 RepID=A0AA42FLI1_9GAMM|nr:MULTISPECIES: helix-turn-helix transcriptional regulator [Providencia]MBC8653760.1 helix-turn-helix transcriptional regulator [Providencia vermicola]AVL76188.1 XRE family transcriptional regulator [Providencia rettgeri]EIU7555254.1 helix-turn-helix transcriptional regulator [Providencia rettgeri]EIU7559527.1 helix-turn-helix transcriptional regulator [Providencia rettgeri]EIU9515306.1 helix-turn-helix transcriptional regulator [Providencia rettgeri]